MSRIRYALLLIVIGNCLASYGIVRFGDVATGETPGFERKEKTMNLCSDKHEEVCYEGRVCPVCDVRDDLQAEIDALKRDNLSLENELAGQ